MTNEKVIGITSCGDSIFCITETGKLVQFDKSIGQFVMRGSSDILDADKANILKKPSEVIDYKHQGRYRNHEPEALPVKSQSRISSMITPVNIAIGLLGLLVLMYFFIK